MQNVKANSEKILGLLGLASRAGKLLKGTDSVVEGLTRGETKLVILAADAGKAVQRNIDRLCLEEKVTCYKVGNLSKADLGNRLGRGAYSVIALTSADFARGVVESLDLLFLID